VSCGNVRLVILHQVVSFTYVKIHDLLGCDIVLVW
jgi:hypothetical protein